MKSKESMEAERLFAKKDYAACLLLFKKQLEREPANAKLLNNVAVCFIRLGEFFSAAQLLIIAAHHAPKDAEVFMNMGTAFLGMGSIKEAVHACDIAIELDPSNSAAFSNRLLYMQYLETCTPELMHNWALRYGSRFAHVRPREKKSLWRRRWIGDGRPIEVGIVSPNLYTHSVAYFLFSWLRAYDRNKFHITLYGDNETLDKVTDKMRELAGAYYDSSRWSDNKLSRKMEDRKTIIAFDLAGHTGNNRLPLFSRRLAPIQISWLGFLGTTGIREIDYRILDPWTTVDPTLSVERQICLRGGLHCYTPIFEEPIVPKDPGNYGRRFCNFGNLAKIGVDTRKLWSRLVLACPEAYLRLKAHGLQGNKMRALWTGNMERAGLPPAWLELEGPIRYGDGYLRELGTMDVWLDSQPYASATTACEALYMGLPVITMKGRTPTGNLGCSILGSAGLTSVFVAEDSEDYIRKALLPAYSGLELRKRVIASRLFDAKAFAAELEESLLAIIEEERTDAL